MSKQSAINMQKLANIIKNDGLAVVPTDTIYGIVALASSKVATEKVFALKGRTLSKPPIVLITSLDQMFSAPPKLALKTLKKYWPGSNSIILPDANAPSWITRGTGTVAYRMISSDINLYALIAQTGPLIAPSANPEGLPPAKNIAQAKEYFGDQIDFYLDGGETTDTAPSNLYLWSKDGMKQLR